VKNLNTSDFHLPYNPKLITRAKELRKNMTPAERRLWYQYLRTFKYRVFRQRSIDHFIVDFYCHSLQLVIEIDGDSHFTEEAQAADRERTQILESYGLSVIRFTNQEVLQDFESVCNRIAAEIPLIFPEKEDFESGSPLLKGG
jgi:very-short-patch-repair endonuclease